jgi:hypothetical protein
MYDAPCSPTGLYGDFGIIRRNARTGLSVSGTTRLNDRKKGEKTWEDHYRVKLQTHFDMGWRTYIEPYQLVT